MTGLNILHHCAVQVKLLTPGSLGQGAPSSPSASQQASSAGGMWCQTSAPQPLTGQISIILSPLYTLYNALPTLLHWRLVNTADAQQPAQDWQTPGQGQSGVLQPGEETALAVALEAGQALSFQLPRGAVESGPTIDATPGQVTYTHTHTHTVASC